MGFLILVNEVDGVGKLAPMMTIIVDSSRDYGCSVNRVAILNGQDDNVASADVT